MPRISNLKAFNGTEKKIDRLGIRCLWSELQEILTRFRLEVEERPHANSSAIVQKMLVRRFTTAHGWDKQERNHLSWRKSLTVNGTRVCLGVKIRVVRRSDLPSKDLMIVDVVSLIRQVTFGAVDIAVLVVPSDALSAYLGVRAPKFADAVRAVERSRATDLPLIILALEHDGPGPALPKRRTRQGRVEATGG